MERESSHKRITQEEYKHNVELLAIAPLHSELSFDNVKPFDGPDVVVSYGGKIIGIEVVGCHSESVLSKDKINYSRNEKIVSCALKEYNQTLKLKGSCTSFVSVCWNEMAVRNIPQKSDRKQISRQIAEEIDAYLQCGDDAECNYINSAELLDYGIEDVYMSSAAYWEEPIKEECILHCVHKKEAKLPIYQQKKENQDITGYWLVIHFMHDISKNINTFALSTPIATQYSRIYLTQYGDIKRIK